MICNKQSNIFYANFFILITSFSYICGISKHDKELIKKYSINDQKIKEKLNEVFKSTTNVHEALKKANFKFIKEENQIVAEHTDIPGFLIKALPNQTFKTTFISNDLNLRRVEMAENIRKVINDNKLKHVIVPKKYLYQIPGAKMELNDKNFIVLSEKLDLVSSEENQKAMRNLTFEQREEIFIVIESVGLFDTRCTNIVFTKKGEIAFIDTEPRWNFKIPFISNILKKIASQKGVRRFYHDITRSLDIEEHAKNDDTLTVELS